ncbi:hypothetical protein BDF22DRAFT_702401 [Syncephalis plumigaleata]|nr:hypothetical protein BDF22DRAFT_702401 [Syncephalis plumigaleata]
MSNIFTGGADCSSGNAMTGLLKQYSRDRSLQQDAGMSSRGMSQGHSSTSVFRQGTRPGNNLTDEFLRESEFGAHPNVPASNHHPGLAAGHHLQHRDPFSFGALGEELELIDGPPPSHDMTTAKDKAPMSSGIRDIGLTNWTDDFAQHEHAAIANRVDSVEWKAFDQAFDAAQAQHKDVGWQAEFTQFEATHHHDVQSSLNNDPALQEQFEKAFDEAGQDVQWENEFTQQNKEASWAEEFNDGLATDGDSRAALAATAGQVVDIVNESSNPKFKQSNFLQFMRRLRDQEVVVEGNKVVEQHAPTTSWSNEFSQQQQQQQQPSKATNWSEEFTADTVETTRNHSQHDNRWANEFAKEDNSKHDSWAASFVEHQMEATTNTAVGDQWAREFEAMHGTTSTAGASTSTDVPDTITSERNRLDEWAEMYRKNIAHLSDDPVDHEWEQLAKAWEQQAMNEQENEMNALEAVGPEYDEYPFQVDNPFLRDPTRLTAATASSHGRSLHEEILEHEAVVQLNPNNAEAWRRLGLLQQENERDTAAIAAFRQTIRLNATSNNGNSVDQQYTDNPVSVALAIAYANENCRKDAYAELERWITEHPVYGRMAGKAPMEQPLSASSSSLNTMDRHARIEQAMIHAVQTHQDQLDAELQAGLGVLFNLSNEPLKAVDCFQAAVQARPEDHLLWNRLGASLANSGDYPAAVDAYRRALELRPGYVRARYNIGISCINLGLYNEAAGHLLTALALQSPAATTMPPSSHMHGNATTTTDSLWTALRMTMNMIDRPDLAAECDRRDLGAFQKDFDF